MKSLYITGDSHAGKLANVLFENMYNVYGPNREFATVNSDYYNKVVDHIDPNGNKVLHGMSSNLASIELEDKKITIASTPGRSALNLDYDFYDYTSGWDHNDGIVMPWYGYIDIKNWLPQTGLNNYKNTEDVVEAYVEKTIKKFNKSKIIFINPMPQFLVVTTARWSNFSSDPDIQFEDRYSYHLEFTEKLKNKCAASGLETPIDISEILDAKWIEPDMQFKKPINMAYNDHLIPKYYDNILSSIISKVIG
jgi:hypothetical protein